MPNMQLFTGISMKCNKDVATTSHERGAKRGKCTPRGGSLARGGGASSWEAALQVATGGGGLMRGGGAGGREATGQPTE